MKAFSSIIFMYLLLTFLTAAGYITNAIWLFKNFNLGITLETVISLVGVVAAPLGVFHGFYLWL